MAKRKKRAAVSRGQTSRKTPSKTRAVAGKGKSAGKTRGIVALPRKEVRRKVVKRKAPKPIQLSSADRVKTLLQLLTPKQAAKKLKVSTTTLRRYRDAKGKPTDKKVVKRLNRESGKARRKILNQGKSKSQGFKTPNVRVPLVGRRQTRVDPRNRKRRIPSDTIIYDARYVGLGEIAELLYAYRKKHAAFRVIYLLPKGKSDYTKQKYTADHRVSTAWESLRQSRFAGIDGILDYLGEISRIGKILYVVVTDRG